MRWGQDYLNPRTNSVLLTNSRKTTFGFNFNIRNQLSTKAFIWIAASIDLFIDGVLILELKSVDKLTAVHEAQLLTYMKLANVKAGLLINFNVTKLKDGIKRFVL